MLHTHNELMKTEQWDVTHLDITQVRIQAMAKVAGSVSHLAYRVLTVAYNSVGSLKKFCDRGISMQPSLLRDKMF